MLVELSIRDFALVRELSIRLCESLNILTGETGAGKSIVIDALQTLLGSRALQIKIRSGADRARVEGLFRLSGDREELLSPLKNAGIDTEDGEIVIRRELFRDEPSRCTINGYLVPATLLRKLGRKLVDFHGQQETSSLRDPASQLDLLDSYGNTLDQSRRIRSLFEDRTKLIRELGCVDTELREIEERVKGLEEDISEIDSVGAEVGEEEELMRQKDLISNFEQVSLLSGIIFDTLSDDEHGIVSELSKLEASFRELVSLTGDLEDLQKQIEGAHYSLEEVVRRLGSFIQDVEYDPEKLESIRLRLARIARVKRRFGENIDEVLKYRERAVRILTRREELAERKRRLKEEIMGIGKRMLNESEKLSSKRISVAKKLEKATEKGMKDLGLEHARFRVEFSRRPAASDGGDPVDSIGRSGFDRIRFMVSTNPGEPLLPLSRVASGGELSRIMLAMKAAIADRDRTPILIFDEVDAGIGGEVGIRVGEKLAEIASSRQVLVITHLPQIAVRAHEHLLVKKMEEKGETDIRLKKLDWNERMEEISRMLGGDPMSSISQEHAREMLTSAGEGVEQEH